jgi:hypothetical protein
MTDSQHSGQELVATISGGTEQPAAVRQSRLTGHVAPPPHDMPAVKSASTLNNQQANGPVCHAPPAGCRASTTPVAVMRESAASPSWYDQPPSLNQPELPPPVPQESMSNRSATPAFSTTALNTASALGLLQMFPVTSASLNAPSARLVFAALRLQSGPGKVCISSMRSSALAHAAQALTTTLRCASHLTQHPTTYLNKQTTLQFCCHAPVAGMQAVSNRPRLGKKAGRAP